MRLVKKSWILGVGILLLQIGMGTEASLPKKKMPATSPTNNPLTSTNPLRPLLKQVDTGSEPEVAAPESRIFAPTISQSVSPYILMHTGCREADNNGSWKRHVVKDAFGNLHVLYAVYNFDVFNRHKYNCLAAGASAMTFPEWAEPQASPPQTDQNGGIDVRPSGRVVWVGRGLSGTTGTIVSFDSNSCYGWITTDTVANDPSRPLDPAIYVVDETTWVAFMANYNNDDIVSSRTTDGGETWTPQIPVITSSFLNFTVTGKGNTIYVFSVAIFGDCFLGPCDEVFYTKSTDGGVSWDYTIFLSGSFELPTYVPLFNGSLSALMIGDTAHVFWLDKEIDNSALLPGGHVHRMAVEPNGVLQGPHKVADINIYFDINYDNTTTGYGIGHGIWQHPTAAYNESTGILYCLWSSPPEDPTNPGLPADTSASSVTPNGRVFPNADIWLTASRTNGRTWDAKTNVTQTNHPGCDGTITPCEHEFYISAAEVADSIIYVVAQVNKFPGFQVLGDPGPDTRLSDEWRLYLVPARKPVGRKGDINDDGIFTSADVVMLLNCIFLNLGPCDLSFADVNCDNLLTSADVVEELNNVFLGIPFSCP